MSSEKILFSYYISSGRWIADIFVRYLPVLNSSTNFIIYSFYGSKFREALRSNCPLLCRSESREAGGEVSTRMLSVNNNSNNSSPKNNSVVTRETETRIILWIFFRVGLDFVKILADVPEINKSVVREILRIKC